VGIHLSQNELLPPIIGQPPNRHPTTCCTLVAPRHKPSKKGRNQGESNPIRPPNFSPAQAHSPPMMLSRFAQNPRKNAKIQVDPTASETGKKTTKGSTSRDWSINGTDPADFLDADHRPSHFPHNQWNGLGESGRGGVDPETPYHRKPSNLPCKALKKHFTLWLHLPGIRDTRPGFQIVQAPLAQRRTR